MRAQFLRPSKEQIRNMPPFEGLDLDNIIIVDSDARLAMAKDILINVTSIGFDTESKPTFNKGEVSQGPHIIQLATSRCALIITPHFLPGITLALDILQSDSISKYGFGLSGDKRLFRHKFGADIKNTVDLVTITKKTFDLKQGAGARASIAMLFQQRLSKSAQMSNWDNYPLKPQQIIYAANDAYAGLCVANKLKSLGLIS
jgi:ribonuclease D